MIVLQRVGGGGLEAGYVGCLYGCMCVWGEGGRGGLVGDFV